MTCLLGKRYALSPNKKQAPKHPKRPVQETGSSLLLPSLTWYAVERGVQGTLDLPASLAGCRTFPTYDKSRADIMLHVCESGKQETGVPYFHVACDIKVSASIR